MQTLSHADFENVAKKLGEFMQYTQRLESGDSYLIVNRNSPALTNAAVFAAENYGLRVRTPFNLRAQKVYEHFPPSLLKLLKEKTPKGGISFFDYTKNPDWNLEERGARIEFLKGTIEQVPTRWGHSPGITLDMAVNGPLQCDYKKMAEQAELMLEQLYNVKELHITAPGGTDIRIKIPKEVKFDTDCIIVKNIYGLPGKFGNLPIGEDWCEKSVDVEVLDKATGKKTIQSYPVRLMADGVLVCDVCVGGYDKRLEPSEFIKVKFKNGKIASFECEQPALRHSYEVMLESEKRYGKPTVLQEVGIGFNDKARVTGNMLEDEKLGGTCHLAPGNIRVHEDMLFDKPTIKVVYIDGSERVIMEKGVAI